VSTYANAFKVFTHLLLRKKRAVFTAPFVAKYANMRSVLRKKMYKQQLNCSSMESASKIVHICLFNTETDFYDSILSK